jgi:hypothetical protein
MSRIRFLMLAIVTFAVTAQVNGGAYIGSVLYPLTVPGGFTSIVPQATFPGQMVGYGTSATIADNTHALLWTAAGAVDLNPTNLNLIGSYAYGSGGDQQVGYGYNIGGPGYALLWTGTAVSVVNLDPSNKSANDYSEAFGTNGTQQVGDAFNENTEGNYHAILWTGTAASAVDLNPTDLNGITSSAAYGTDGVQQVGEGEGSGTNGFRNALLWTNTADSAVDLSPTDISGVSETFALGVGGDQQVGIGYEPGGGPHYALLWTGTADSAVDLNPTNISGVISSAADATNGTEQVGYGIISPTKGQIGDTNHAFLWTGSPDSAVDLGTLLPSTGAWYYSNALNIDSSGNVYGIAQGTYDGVEGYFAVEWSPVPEPASGSLLLIAAAGTLLRRRRK